jgi:drug/metabolite transporter (DMT)-like permease
MGSHSLGIYFAVFVACCFDFLQLAAQNIAFQNDSSGFVSILGYMTIVYGFAADELIFHQSINGMELVGATLIFIVCITTAIVKLGLKLKSTTKK